MRVHVNTPTRGTSVRPEHALFREWLLTHETRYELVGRYTEGYPISVSRNRIVAAFLADTEAGYLLMLDDDQVPTCNPLDYIERDLDVLGFPYPTIRVNDPGQIFWFPCEAEEGAGPVKSEVVGGGCFLIARRVLEHPALVWPFIERFNDDGTICTGEDVQFCRRVWGAGFTIWIALSQPLLHWKIGEVLGLWEARNK